MAEFYDFYYPIIVIIVLIYPLYYLIGYCWWQKIYKDKLTLSAYAPSKPQPLQKTPDHRFNESLCGCFGNWRTCMVLCCCGPFKIVETALTVGVIQKDKLISNLLFLFCCPCFYSCCVHPWRRAGIRAALGGNDGHPVCTWADLALTLMCGFCVYNQEAREVDRAVDAESSVCGNLFQYGTNEAMLVVGLPTKVLDSSGKPKKRRTTMTESIAETMKERHAEMMKSKRRLTVSESIAEGMVEYKSGIGASI